MTNIGHSIRAGATGPPVGAADPAAPAARERRRWLILAVMVLCLLVVVLDNTVLNVALPRIQQELGASQSQQEWIVDAYTLVFAALLLPYGVLADRLGRRRVLFAGLAVFGASSFAAAFATSPAMLIGLRAVMALGGAAVLPATLSIITNVFDDKERAQAIAIWAGGTGLAAAIGPLVGGGLLDAGFWWGSVLLINVPIVAVGLAAITLVVPDSRDPHPDRLDITGVLLSIAGLVALVYGIIHAGQTGRWTDPSALGPMAAGAALIAAFVWAEARSSHSALDLSWFRRPAFSVATAAIGVTFFAMFGALLIGMYYLQFDRGYTPLGAGVLMLGNAVGAGAGAPLSGRLAARHGAQAVCAAGLTLIAVTFAFMTTWTHTTPVAAIEVAMIALGVGVAAVIAPATESIMSALPKERAGAGSAVNSTVRQLGGALGVAVLGSVLSTVYRSSIAPALLALPGPLQRAAGESIGATQLVVRDAGGRLPGHGAPILRAASDAFVQAIHITTAVSAAATLLAAAVVLAWLPARRRAPAPFTAPARAPRTYGFAAVCACIPVCPGCGDDSAAATPSCTCGPDAAPSPDEEGVMKPSTTALTATTPPAATPRHAARGGIIAGLIGSICCMIGAIAVGADLAGASFATNLMDRYQVYAITVSVALLAGWLIHTARTSGIHLVGIRRHARRLARHLVVMAGTYGVTLGVAFGASLLIRSL